MENQDGMVIFILVGQIDIHLELSHLHHPQPSPHRLEEEEGKKVCLKGKDLIIGTFGSC